MSRLVPLFALLFATLSHADVIETFEQPGTWQVYDGAKRGGTITAVAAPTPRGTLSGRLSWGAVHNPFLEIFPTRNLPLPGLEQSFNGTLTVWVCSPQPRALDGLALRIQDAQGETFQFRATLALPDSGWHQISYRLLPANAPESWGEHKNGVIDLPARFQGFAVNFTAAAANQPGELYLDDMAVTTPGRSITTSRPLWKFDGSEAWRIHDAFAASAHFTPSAQGLLLDVAPLTKDTGIPALENGFALKPLGAPTSITLKCELLSGTGARFSLRLRDARGEIHPFAVKELKPGLNTLTWQIPADKGTPTWGDNTDGVLDPPYYVHELFFHQAPSTQPTQIRLISAEATQRMPLLETMKVEVETGNPIHVLKVGEEGKLALKLSSGATEAVTLDVKGEMEDWSGHRIPLDQTVTVPAGGTVALKLPKTPDTLGIWWVNTTLVDPVGGGELRGRTSFCRMVPAGPTPGRAEGFLFSICTHTERWPQIEQAKEVMAAAMCGAKVIRTGPGWGSIEPQEGVWNWAPMDHMVKQYGDQGMELQYLLAFGTRWAADPKWRNSTNWLDWDRHMPRLDAWKTWCAAMVQRYGDRIKYWEVWNEPDIDFWKGTLDEYLQLLQGAYEAIKPVAPQAQVMTGGFAIYDRNPQFIEAVVDRGQKYFDIFAYHRHGGFEPFRLEVDGPIAAMRARLKPDKPIYFNETAVSSVEGGERSQAETLFKKLTFAWSRGAIGYTWYDLRNDGYDLKDYEHNYGMITQDFYPKAVYPVYNTLATVLKGKQHQQNFDLGANRYAFLFGDAREQVVATWNEAASGPARHYILATDATSAATVDVMGNRTPVPVLPGGRVVLVNGPAPTFLVLTGAKSKATVVGPLADLGGPYVAVPGRALTLHGTFASPLTQAGRLKLTWTAPAGWTVTPAEATLALPAGGRAVATPTVVAPKGTGRAGRETLNLRYEVLGTPLSGSVTVPVDLVVRVDSAAADRPADFVLDQRRDVVTLFGNDPAKNHLVWKGPQDLSAKIWLTRVGEALKLRVAVTDDVHVQSEKAPDWWRADSIQFALAVPGQDGYWELGLAQPETGPAVAGTYAKPNGAADPTALLAPTSQKMPGGLIYEATLPLKAFGLTDALLRAGIRFNLIVNDNDGEGREGWVQITPGIGQRKDPGEFAVVVFE